MKFCIIANPEKYTIQEPLKQVVTWCEKHNKQLLVAEELHRHYSDQIDGSALVVKETEEEAVASSDVVIALGGDGTMLYAAHLVKGTDTPVLGINSGKLGFMANVQPKQIERALTGILKNDYTIDKRYMLQARSSDGKSHFALNEFLFSKKDTSSMIRLEAEYDGQYLNHYWADGLIISSPTGSTAYNLSAGGPIVMPGTEVMVLTPINPHTLTTRPMVLPSNKSLKIKASDTEGHILFSNDGRMIPYHQKLDIDIRQSDFTINLIQFPEYTYFETLRNKLMWGLDKRKV
jgi:NAD+ kinase